MAVVNKGAFKKAGIFVSVNNKQINEVLYTINK